MGHVKGLRYNEGAYANGFVFCAYCNEWMKDDGSVLHICGRKLRRKPGSSAARERLRIALEERALQQSIPAAVG